MKILVLNSGSSSEKACLYEIGDLLPARAPQPLWQGKIEWRGGTAVMVVKNGTGIAVEKKLPASSHCQVTRDMLETAFAGSPGAPPTRIDMVGHRVVHGGPYFDLPTLITPQVRAKIRDLEVFAPLHVPAEVAGMDLVEELLGSVPQVAVFDTGFHRHIPLPAAVYPGPYEWFENGIRRYGFHGINHQYCAGRVAQMLAGEKSLKLVSCHLGNGCSLTAIEGGRSVDTTMGFTPLEGLMMGTRSGSVDPGILTYLMRTRDLDTQGIDTMLNQQSGLLGISGLSGDMREILAAVRRGEKRAKLAFHIYIHRLRAAMGAMVAVLGGMDALVFTAGVGENSPEIRAEACRGFEFLGLRLDHEANARPSLDQDVSAPESRVRVLVVRAEEDWAIAQECWKLARGSPSRRVNAPPDES